MQDNDQKRNAAIKRSYKIAKGIIYQSRFTQEHCQEYLSKIKSNIPHTIIYNGIDMGWCGKPESHGDFNVIAFANWHRWKRLKETIEIFLRFNTEYPNSKLHIIGNIDHEECGGTNIIYHGSSSLNEIKSVLRKCDVGLYLAKNDWCPNSLLEIIGAGIPIITTDAGGGATELANLIPGCVICKGELIQELTPELAQELSQDKGSLDHCSEDFNFMPENIKESILNALIKMHKRKGRIKIIDNKLEAEYVANEYIKFINDLFQTFGNGRGLRLIS